MSWVDDFPQEKVEAGIAQLKAGNGPRWQRCKEYAGDDDRFAMWLWYVDRRVERLTAVSMFDLADWNTRDAYEGGTSPKEAAIEALEGDDTYSLFVRELTEGDE